MTSNDLQLSFREKVGQLFFPAAFINDTEENIREVENLIKNYCIGGLTFFHSRQSAATNFEGKKEIIRNEDSALRLQELIARYQKASKIPLLISIDAEWGLAMRIEKTPQYPYSITLGALPESENNLIFEVGKNIGIDLKKLGIDYNLAPVVDINDNPKNPVIGYRSFGDNRKNVADKSQYFIKGLQFSNVLSCLKHFPGHGNTSVDSHLGLPVINKSIEELEAQELYPFKIAIERNEVDSIMIGHLAVPAYTNGTIVSATLSSEIIQNLLREQLGFYGLIISDALNMHSVSKLYPEKGLLEWKAFEAGNDILCFSENVAEGIEEIVKNATTERVDASFERLFKAKNKVGLLIEDKNKASEHLNFDFETAEKLNQEIANKVIKISKNKVLLLPLKKDAKTAIVCIYNSNNSVFCKILQEQTNCDVLEILKPNETNFEEVFMKLLNYDSIIIALFVPSVKPLNNFEIDASALEFISNLTENPKVALCLFGNPYALSAIPNHEKLQTLVHCYQYFDAFQKAAATVLL